MDADPVFPPPPVLRMSEADAPEGVLVLELAGELDLATAGRFRRLLEDARTRGRTGVVIDLTEVSFMDSTMLRELLRARAETEGAGGRLVLAGAQASVARLLDLTGTADVFRLTADRDAALAEVAR